MSDTLTAKDFATDQDVRWCPGCGDYSILKQAQSVVAELAENEKKLYSFRVLVAPVDSHITWKPTECTPFTDAPPLLLAD